MKKKYTNPSVVVFEIDTTDSIMLGSNTDKPTESPKETMPEGGDFDAGGYRSGLWN